MPGHADGDLATAARRQLRSWWGAQVDTWDHIHTYRIAHGQPGQQPPFSPKQAVAMADGRFVCGDHRDTASTQGALIFRSAVRPGRCGTACLTVDQSLVGPRRRVPAPASPISWEA